MQTAVQEALGAKWFYIYEEKHHCKKKHTVQALG